MKLFSTLLVINLVLSVQFVLFAPLAFSQEGAKPCLEIKKACESAGYSKTNAKSGKSLYKDCMQKITSGESVSGVTLSNDIVSGCKSRSE